jgi:hypothetical protein
MTDNATIAAILAAGMLPPLLAPATDADGVIGADEQARFVMDVLHAVGLYRAVLEALTNQASNRQPEFGATVRHIRLGGREPVEAGVKTDAGGDEGDRNGNRSGLI